MAKASKKTIEKTVTETVIVLELTELEAKSLREMVDSYGDRPIHWDIRYALDVPQSDDRPIKVGDRVKVLEDDPEERYGDFVGMTGVVTLVDSSDLPYRVMFDEGQHSPLSSWWVTSVERVDD